MVRKRKADKVGEIDINRRKEKKYFDDNNEEVESDNDIETNNIQHETNDKQKTDESDVDESPDIIHSKDNYIETLKQLHNNLLIKKSKKKTQNKKKIVDISSAFEIDNNLLKNLDFIQSQVNEDEEESDNDNNKNLSKIRINRNKRVESKIIDNVEMKVISQNINPLHAYTIPKDASSFLNNMITNKPRTRMASVEKARQNENSGGIIIYDILEIKWTNVKKLITKEDAHNAHLHKILGTVCLIHYFYRAYLVLTKNSMMFDSSGFTILTITVHMLLNASSFLFRISNTRIKIAPMIYPEARWHSLIFAYRTFLTMILMWVARKFEIVLPLYFRTLIVLLAMYFADRATAHFKDQGTSMRGMPMPEYFSPYAAAKLNQFYAICQIFATCQIIFSYNMDGVFAVAFPIQISMLLMTLVRKSIISSGSWHFWYAVSLSTNILLNMHAKVYNPIPWPGGFIIPCTIFVSIMRFHVPYINKYYVWTIVGFVHLYAMIVLKRYLVTI